MTRFDVIYAPKGPALEYSAWACNIVKSAQGNEGPRSCSHGCLYCYNHPGSQDGPILKDNILDRLKNDLKRLKAIIKKNEKIDFTFVGDLYDSSLPVGISRQCLQACKNAEIPFQVLTKNGIDAAKDFDLYGLDDLFGVTLTCDNDKDSLHFEPKAPLWNTRIDALRIACEKGIRTWVSFEPVVNPEQTFHLIEMVAPFADKIKVGKLNTRNNQYWHSDEIKELAGTISWEDFGKRAVALLEKLGKDYYIKADLAQLISEHQPGTISEIFNNPGNKFVLLPEGIKFPPIEKEWEKRGHTFAEAITHKGNVGLMAGNGRIGLDQDDPSAFVGLELPTSTTWETRPGRRAMQFLCNDRTPEVLAIHGKNADQAQIKLYKNGLPVGEVKLERTYQVIPPSWKRLENGLIADYKLISEIPPAEISLKKLLADLKTSGITFSKNEHLESNAQKLESLVKESKQQKTTSDDRLAKKYAEAALNGEVDKVRNANRGERNDQLFKSTASLAEFVRTGLLTESEIAQAMERVADDDEPVKIPKTISSGLKAGQRKARQIPEPEVPFIKLKSKGVVQGSEEKYRQSSKKQSSDKSDKPIIVLTEPETKLILVSKTKNNQGNVEWLIELHSHDLKYVREYKDWVRWDGIKWRRDETAVTRALADVVKILYDIARCTEDDEERGKNARFASSCGNNAVYMATAQLASRNKNFSVSLLEFDKNDFELNLLNGVLDLNNGKLRPHSHLDKVMKCVGYAFNGEMTCPKWLQFLEEIYGGDKDLIGYLQRVVGRCLTGSNSDKAFFFLFGPDGDNGKSKILEVLRALLGEYAYHAAFSTFLKSRNDKHVRDDLAPFYGMRLVTSSEPDEGKLFELNTIKGITGGDPITCRELYGKLFSFIPTCKLFFAANNRPAITERSNAAWDRVRVIPHKVSIPKEKQDPMLAEKLKKELPGILNWALEGLKEYNRLGNLADPESVKLEVKEYRLDNDTVRQFIDEVCVFKDTMQSLGPDLYDSYKEFCYDTGKRPLGLTKFTSAMLGATIPRGVTRKRGNYGWMWYGIHAPEARHRYGRGE